MIIVAEPTISTSARQWPVAAKIGDIRATR